MTENTNIWLNGIMGVVVGDALGCPVQFESREEVARHPVTGMRGYGTFNLPEGSWTDDSSLTIALLESIRRVGEIDLGDIMENFMKWLYDGEFTPYGESYDIGRGTMQAINRYKKNRKAKKCGGDEEWNNGNGSLMRIMPACLYCSVMESSGMYSDRDAIDVIHSVGGLTHAHIRSNIACGLYFFMAKYILFREGSVFVYRLPYHKDRLHSIGFSSVRLMPFIPYLLMILPIVFAAPATIQCFLFGRYTWHHISLLPASRHGSAAGPHQE